MGITPLLDRHPEFPREVLGYAMAAFFGGRAECRIRRVPVPVDLVDFTSMYPTVDALMDLHRLQLASRIEISDTGGVASCSDRSTLDDCFDPAFGPSWSASPWSTRGRHPPGPGRLQRQDLGHRGQPGDLRRAPLVLARRLCRFELLTGKDRRTPSPSAWWRWGQRRRCAPFGCGERSRSTLGAGPNGDHGGGTQPAEQR